MRQRAAQKAFSGTSNAAPSGASKIVPPTQLSRRAVQVFSGTYELEVVKPDDRLRARYLVLGTGERIVLGYGLNPDEFHLVDRSVTVRGRRFNARPGEFPLAQGHIEVSQIALGPGEKPNPQRNSSLPIPPTVSTTDETVARASRWAQVKGTLISVTSDPRTLAHRARLRLMDGCIVQVDYLSSAMAKKWIVKAGKEVRLVGRVRLGRPIRVDGPVALCPGPQPICTQL